VSGTTFYLLDGLPAEESGEENLVPE